MTRSDKALASTMMELAGCGVDPHAVIFSATPIILDGASGSIEECPGGNVDDKLRAPAIRLHSLSDGFDACPYFYPPGPA